MPNALSQIFPPKPKWTPDNIPDLSGKVFVVTGANIGIGYYTAKELLRHKAKVYVACRSKTKAEEAIQKLADEEAIKAAKVNVHENAVFLELDLGDLDSVKKAAEKYLEHESGLNALIANAGVMAPPIEPLTKQGYDLQCGTNAVGHWYFTQLLLPALKATASEGASAARVVTVASSGADLAPKINWDVLGGPNVDADKTSKARKRFGTNLLYAQSKLMNVMLSNEFALRYKDTGIIFSSLNPGNITSGLQRHLPLWQDLMLKPILNPPELGCISQLYAATSPDATINGAYYVPWARLGTNAKLADDLETRAKLWTWLEAEVEKLHGKPATH